MGTQRQQSGGLRAGVWPSGQAAQRTVEQSTFAASTADSVVAGLVPPGRGRTAAGALAWLAGPRVIAGGGDMADMATTIEAEDAFDLAECPAIRAPTVILAGGDDRFYSPDLFAETARLIPGSRLRVFEGCGHVTVGRHPEWPSEIERFLADGA